MRTSQTSEDQQNRSAHVGDRIGASASYQASHKGCDPKVEWLLEAARHVIRLKVAGFKKEQLRVQANMILKEVIVTGKQPVEDGKLVEFNKKFKLEDDLYKMDEIRAKLRHGCLDIILPLKEPRPLSNSPAGEVTKVAINNNIGPKPDADASQGSFLGLTVEKKHAWRVLGSLVIAVGAIGLGAFLVYRYFII